VLAQRLALLEERMRRREAADNRDEDDDEPDVEFAEVGTPRRERAFRRAGKP
jgi:hypothetical protein